MPQPGYVSASQVPALFDASPYQSKFAIWHYHKDGSDIDPPDNQRMAFGRALQNVILEAVSDRMKWDLVPNPEDTFAVHPDESLRLGATVDCRVREHEGGPGVVEVKNVDRIVWLQEWTKEQAPPHIELQLQTQLMVDNAPWGAIAAFIGGNELKLYERTRNEKQCKAIEKAVREFWDTIKQGREPDPMASDLGLLGDLFPEVDATKIERDDTAEMNQIALDYMSLAATENDAKKRKGALKAKLLHRMKDAGVLYTNDFKVTVTKSKLDAYMVSAQTRTLLKVKEQGEGEAFLG